MGQPDHEAPEIPEEIACDEAVSPVGRTHAERVQEKLEDPAYRAAFMARVEELCEENRETLEALAKT